MRLGGASLLLVLSALLATASLSTPPAWGACHTTHANFYCGLDDSGKCLGRRSVEAVYNWVTLGCVPAGCEYSPESETGWECIDMLRRYACPWWGKECAQIQPCWSPVYVKFNKPPGQFMGKPGSSGDCGCYYQGR